MITDDGCNFDHAEVASAFLNPYVYEEEINMTLPECGREGLIPPVINVQLPKAHDGRKRAP
jgi:hypothetical protein